MFIHSRVGLNEDLDQTEVVTNAHVRLKRRLIFKALKPKAGVNFRTILMHDVKFPPD